MKHLAATLDITRSNESSKSVPKRISTRCWNGIKCFHIIEPAHMQLYVAMNPHIPHYQVPATMAKQYLQCLQEFLSKKTDKEAKIYRNTIGIHHHHFLTVINDMDFCPELNSLSKRFDHTEAMSVIQNYREQGKEDGSRNTVFFDRDKSCRQNQIRTANSFGLTVPRDCVSVTTMNTAEEDFYDQAELMLYKAMK
eukprot:5833573-Ditylum_brightwellii.AAC.1